MEKSQEKLNQIEKEILKFLIDGIPLIKRPFKELAEKLNLTEEEVLEIIKQLKEKGIIRRLGATIRHNRVGYKGNAMVAWEVPEEKIDEIGNYLATQEYISHCYIRKTYPDWPYNLYIMIHAKTREEISKIVNEIAKKFNISNYQILFTEKEIVRKHSKYFF